MPHKHRRNKTADPSTHDLPPTKLAHALPVKKPPNSSKTQPHQKRKAKQDDDTPRAFTRLLGPYRPPRSGLDDGTRPSKKRKSTSTTAVPSKSAPAAAAPLPAVIPKIQPHEPLSSFNARVDAALPFNSVPKHRSGGPGWQSRTEKRMQRMQAEWREEERRIREKKILEGEGGDGSVDEDGAEDMGVESPEEKGKDKKGKRKKSKRDEEEGDIWAGIKAKRADQGEEGRGLVGLHDVVQAPPRFVKVGKFWDGDAGGVGKDLGLKRAEELREGRKSVVEGYRALMRERRGKGVEVG